MSDNDDLFPVWLNDLIDYCLSDMAIAEHQSNDYMVAMLVSKGPDLADYTVKIKLEIQPGIETIVKRRKQSCGHCGTTHTPSEEDRDG